MNRLELEPLRAENGGQHLERFEVVVARNLDMPWRWAQKLYWLEVLASDARQALACATRWSMEGDSSLEPTSLVRRSEPHVAHLGHDARGMPLGIDWGLPLAAGLPPGFTVRRPEDGLRVGFIAHPRASTRWLPVEAQERFVLLTRKPTESGEPVCLAPVCQSIQVGSGAERSTT